MKNNLKKIFVGISILAVIILVGSFKFSVSPVADMSFGATNAIPTPIALFQTSLASGITSTATSMTLVSATDKDGNSLSGTYAFIIDEGTASEEFVNADCTGTACTNMTRGLSVVTGTTSIANLKFSHRRGASVKITDAPQLLILHRVLNGISTIPNPITYATGIGPVGSSDLTDKEYVLSVVSGGTVSFDQEIVAGIAGETVAAGELLYFSETENEWMKTDADTLTTVFNVKLGIAQGAGTNGSTITGGVLVSGSYTTSGLTQGDLVYASNTAGAFNSGTAGTVPKVIGIAKDATTLYFDPYFQNRLYDYAVDSVGTDAYAITLSGGLSVPYAGMEVKFKAGTANTGAATLAINGGSAIAIKKEVSQALNTGDILANQIVKVVYDGTNWQIISNIQITNPVVNTYLTAASPATWTKPVGLKYVIVEVQAGGGGGGGGGSGGGAGATSGSGGGGGGYSRKLITAATLGATETVTIGAGGTAGATLGGTGGSSSFGTHSTATGGTGGQIDAAGGTGGIGSSGDINIKGQSGGIAVSGDHIRGTGGSSHLGGGGTGGDLSVGENGGVYGGGGGGGQTTSGGSASSGGVGGAGIVIVTEFY